ncbi:MAG TPA: hypothetical protein VNG12_16905 [Acidimicrobiales bacterium]|nr:hypothetical protein [Acidimicrobiales bacterium]
MLLGAMAVRLFWAFSLTIAESELIYRTPLTTKRIPRSQIVDIGIKRQQIGTGYTKPWVPYLELTDGSTKELLQLAASNQSGLDEPDHYGPQAQRMLEAAHAWLRQNPSPPRPILAPPGASTPTSAVPQSKYAWIPMTVASTVALIGLVVFRIQNHGASGIGPLGLVILIGFLASATLTIRFRMRARGKSTDGTKHP